MQAPAQWTHPTSPSLPRPANRNKGQRENSVLANLRTAEWAQAHGLPVNPYRGQGPSITFFRSDGTIRRHIPLTEADLRPAPRVKSVSNSLWSARRVHPELATATSRVARQGVITDSLLVIGSTEQYWVFEDGVLITKTVLVMDADTVFGASQLAFDELGELMTEQWVTPSSMGTFDPEDPQWEISHPIFPSPRDTGVLLASCELPASYDACSSAVAGMATSGILGAAAAKVCVAFAFAPACWVAKNRAKHFVAMTLLALVTCWGGDETRSPALQEPRRESFMAGASKPGLHLA